MTYLIFSPYIAHPRADKLAARTIRRASNAALTSDKHWRRTASRLRRRPDPAAHDDAGHTRDHASVGSPDGSARDDNRCLPVALRRGAVR
jgi:hypothetical protein